MKFRRRTSSWSTAQRLRLGHDAQRVAQQATKWLNLGIDPTTGVERIIGAGTANQQRVGDPLFMQWYRNYTFSDKNGDGIIQQSEVVVDSARFKHGLQRFREGSRVDPERLRISSRRRMRISALFDYRGGGNTDSTARTALTARRRRRAVKENAWTRRRRSGCRRALFAATFGTTVNPGNDVHEDDARLL